MFSMSSGRCHPSGMKFLDFLVGDTSTLQFIISIPSRCSVLSYAYIIVHDYMHICLKYICVLIVNICAYNIYVFFVSSAVAAVFSL